MPRGTEVSCVVVPSVTTTPATAGRPYAWPPPIRRAKAAVPEHVTFATEPQLLEAMIIRALTAGIPFGWVTADGAYEPGAVSRLHELENLWWLE